MSSLYLVYVKACAGDSTSRALLIALGSLSILAAGLVWIAQ